MIEWLKNPKNAVSWLVVGYVLAVGGYAIWHRFEDVGIIVGFAGSAVMAVTLLRVSLTKIVLGVIIVAAVIAYASWYSKSVTIEAFSQDRVYEHEPWKKYVYARHRPKYAESGMSQRMQEAVFAPAFMAERVVLFPRWRTNITMADNLDYKPPK